LAARAPSLAGSDVVELSDTTIHGRRLIFLGRWESQQVGIEALE
jgi:hypothetical protein